MPQLDILIFRGTGGVQNKNHPYYDEPALVRAGHVGVSGVTEGKIIGFHPTPEAVEALGGTDSFIRKLADNDPQPGRLQDDTSYFERAAALAGETDGRTTVYTYTVEVSDETLELIRTWYNEGKETLYSFPDAQGQFQTGQTNCAMFWKQFGIPLPVTTGSIKLLTDHMKQERYDIWQPNES